MAQNDWPVTVPSGISLQTFKIRSHLQFGIAITQDVLCTNGYYSVIPSAPCNDIHDWLLANHEYLGRYVWIGDICWFDNRDLAVLFEMQWG